jgi:hypothetical protein
LRALAPVRLLVWTWIFVLDKGPIRVELERVAISEAVERVGDLEALCIGCG